MIVFARMHHHGDLAESAPASLLEGGAPDIGYIPLHEPLNSGTCASLCAPQFGRAVIGSAWLVVEKSATGSLIHTL